MSDVLPNAGVNITNHAADPRSGLLWPWKWLRHCDKGSRRWHHSHLCETAGVTQEGVVKSSTQTFLHNIPLPLKHSSRHPCGGQYLFTVDYNRDNWLFIQHSSHVNVFITTRNNLSHTVHYIQMYNKIRPCIPREPHIKLLCLHNDILYYYEYRIIFCIIRFIIFASPTSHYVYFFVRCYVGLRQYFNSTGFASESRLLKLYKKPALNMSYTDIY